MEGTKLLGGGFSGGVYCDDVDGFVEIGVTSWSNVNIERAENKTKTNLLPVRFQFF